MARLKPIDGANLNATEPGDLIWESEDKNYTVRVTNPNVEAEEVSDWYIVPDRGAICTRCSEFSIGGGTPLDVDALLEHQVKAHGYVMLRDRLAAVRGNARNAAAQPAS